MAILAGDALQALAFETLAAALLESGLGARESLAMMASFAETAGPRRLVGGQASDLDAPEESDGLETLRGIHERKTAALIRYCLELGGSLAGLNPDERKPIGEAGKLMGLAFQVVDDLLDATSSREELGKTPGKDRGLGKRTYLDHLGEEGARDEARKLLADALELIPEVEKGEELRVIARRLVERSR